METYTHDKLIEPLLKWHWALGEPWQLLSAFPVVLLLLILLVANMLEIGVRMWLEYRRLP